MGYFQHKHENISEAGILKNCIWCNEEFEMDSGNQKYCKNPACRDDRWIANMTKRQYIKHTNSECLKHDVD